MEKKKSIVWPAIVAILLVVIVTSFIIVRGQAEGGSESLDVAINKEYRDFAEIEEEQWNNGKLNICLITKTYGSAYWETLIDGAVDAAEENGLNLYIAGVASEANTEGLAELMNHAMELNPDAIIVSPADASEVYSAVDGINEKKIPLIFVDTILNGRQFDACFLTDNLQAGRLAAKNMIEKLKEAGHKESETISVGIDIGTKQSQTIIERLAGFNEYWSKNAPAGWRVIDSIKCNNGSADVAYEQCLQYFDENDDLAGLLGLNNGSTVGLCRGLIEKGRKDIVLVGFDYSEEMASLIEGGEYIAATMVQLQYDMGYGSVLEAINICDGKKPEYKYNDTGISTVDHSNYNNSYIRTNVLR